MTCRTCQAPAGELLLTDAPRIDLDEATSLAHWLPALTRALHAATASEAECVMQFAEADGFQHVHFHLIARLPGWQRTARGRASGACSVWRARVPGRDDAGDGSGERLARFGAAADRFRPRVQRDLPGVTERERCRFAGSAVARPPRLDPAPFEPGRAAAQADDQVQWASWKKTAQGLRCSPRGCW